MHKRIITSLLAAVLLTGCGKKQDAANTPPQQGTQSPEYWVNAILLRYLEGKDFTIGYDNKIDEVSAEDVRALLKSLDEAGKVEYIIRRK